MSEEDIEDVETRKIWPRELLDKTRDKNSFSSPPAFNWACYQMTQNFSICSEIRVTKAGWGIYMKDPSEFGKRCSLGRRVVFFAIAKMVNARTQMIEKKIIGLVGEIPTESIRVTAERFFFGFDFNVKKGQVDIVSCFDVENPCTFYDYKQTWKFFEHLCNKHEDELKTRTKKTIRVPGGDTSRSHHKVKTSYSYESPLPPPSSTPVLEESTRFQIKPEEPLSETRTDLLARSDGMEGQPSNWDTICFNSFSESFRCLFSGEHNHSSLFELSESGVAAK